VGERDETSASVPVLLYVRTVQCSTAVSLREEIGDYGGNQRLAVWVQSLWDFGGGRIKVSTISVSTAQQKTKKQKQNKKKKTKKQKQNKKQRLGTYFFHCRQFSCRLASSTAAPSVLFGARSFEARRKGKKKK